MLAVPVTLTIRHVSLPGPDLLVAHLVPFLIIAGISILIFFSAGLYDRATALIKRELPSTIFGVQLVNVLLAALIFFFIPVFNIAPKTNLVIYLLVSTLFVSGWRIFIPVVAERAEKKTAVVIGEGEDVDELVEACGKDGVCPLSVTRVIPSTSTTIVAETEEALSERPDFIVANIADPKLREVVPYIINRMPPDTLIDFTDIYEAVFRKVPLSSVSYQWFLEHATPERVFFDIIKRVIDIVLGIIALVVLLIITPIIFILERVVRDKGGVFIAQDRMGHGYEPIRIFKFRTMTKNEHGAWIGETKNRVTKLGAVLRQTSIDELPQVFSVLKGELSLIGPRSDIMGLAERLADSIPFYRVRYTVRPGITGWAQVNQKYAPGNISPQSVEESKERLKYDLFYIKHRSPLLDLSIVLRTVKTLILRLIPRGKSH